MAGAVGTVSVGDAGVLGRQQGALVDGLDAGYERRRGVKKDSRDLAWETATVGLPSAEAGKAERGLENQELGAGQVGCEMLVRHTSVNVM